MLSACCAVYCAVLPRYIFLWVIQAAFKQIAKSYHGLSV